MKQRVILIFLIMVLLFPCFCFAESSPVVSVDAVYSKTDTSVRVPIVLSGCDCFCSLGIEIDYDDEVMTLVNVESIASVGYNIQSKNLNTVPYVLKWTDSKNIYYNGTLAVLVFDVNADVSDVLPISVSYTKGPLDNYVDGQNINFSIETVNGNIIRHGLNLRYQSGYIKVIPDDTIAYIADYDNFGKMISINSLTQDYYSVSLSQYQKLFLLNKTNYVPSDY